MENKINKYLNNKYFQAGIFFLILQLSIIYHLFSVNRIIILIWFCNHSPLLFAIAFFLKNKNMINGLINFGLLIQIIWIVDFFNVTITGTSLFGTINYLFESENFSSFFIPTVVHIFGVVVAFLITFREKPSRRDLYYSGAYIALVYIITNIFTHPKNNTNCIQNVCGGIFDIPGYTLLWPVLSFIVIVLTTQLLRYLIWEKYFNKKSKNKN